MALVHFGLLGQENESVYMDPDVSWWHGDLSPFVCVCISLLCCHDGPFMQHLPSKDVRMSPVMHFCESAHWLEEAAFICSLL